MFFISFSRIPEKKLKSFFHYSWSIGSTAQHYANLCIRFSAFSFSASKMSFTKSLESMDIATLEAFEASQMAILKAIRKAKKDKMQESGIVAKSNVWVAWSKQVKSLYSDEYETEAEAFKSANGKLFGFLGKFAKKMKETHSEDYETFKADHAKPSEDEEKEEEKPKSKKTAPKKTKKSDEESEEKKPKKTRAKSKKTADSDAEEEKPKKRGRPAKKAAVEEVVSDDE